MVRLGSVIAIGLAAGLLVGADDPSGIPNDGLDRFVGSWTCSGHFVPSNRPISATLAITRDPSTDAIIIRHDDVAPGRFHSIELWTANRPSLGFRASVADNFTGTRWFVSPGWDGDVLRWSRPDTDKPTEQFVYTAVGQDRMRIDWNIVRGANPLTLGDTLDCRREGKR